MARERDITIESALPVVSANGLNTNKNVDFSGAPSTLVSQIIVFPETITSLGTTQNSTPTIAQLLTGIVTQTGATGGGTVTLPTGTLISTAVSSALTGSTPLAVGFTFDCIFANLGGGQTLTITGATGSTVVGTAAVGSGKNAQLIFTNTGTNTWNVYTMVSA